MPPGADASPFAITKGPDGNMWFTERSRNAIGRITSAGTVTEFPVPGALDLAHITSGPGGLLWFTDDSASFIGSISTGGVINTYPANFTYTYGSYSYTYAAYPDDITVGPDGALYFTSYYYIGRFDPNSHAITTLNPA
ncbi:MAG TPA: hypothetical protein VGR50_01230, partial [Terriglobales bacterium]|nr:hypothetical protein [Terriglobales bacterium]